MVLRGAGYLTTPATTLGEAFESAQDAPPDAAIVDLLLPDGSGIDLCRELRSWSRMPILVLSGLDEEADKVAALEAGADDYVTKPLPPGELVARLDAVFRRVGDEPPEPRIVVGELAIDLPGHAVTRAGRPVHLTPTEFTLLTTLARNRGRLMTSRSLLRHVWGEGHAHDAPLLRTHIANLRQKIEGGSGGVRGQAFIKTEPGIGYRFVD